MDDRLEQIKRIVKKELVHCSAHGFDHVMRVHDMALRLAQGEKVDLEVITLAALLHDIGGKEEISDPTGKTDHAVVSARMAEPILQELGYPHETIKQVMSCILSHRYRTENKPLSLEAQILFDADKLEGLGAIGIARMFVWIGTNKACIYRKVDIGEYVTENMGGKIDGRIRDKTQHSANIEWETRNKHIINLLHTDKAKRIAKERTAFSEAFFKRLEQECGSR